MKDMKKLAEKGRNGDTRVAHLSEGEVVVPREVAALRPDLIAHVAEQLRRMGGNPRQMIVGRGRKNPDTGIEEFATEEEVRQAYKTVLNRDPDAEGLKFWMGAGDLNMDVFRQAAKPELVAQAYDRILGRAPDAEGAAFWQNDPNFNLGNFALAAQPEIAGQRKAMSEQLAALQSQFGPMSEQYNALQGQYGTLQEQLMLLQMRYDELLKNQSKGGGSDGGVTVGGSFVDDGSTFNTGAGLGTSGVVYGPDGTAYSSAAAAIAAGVVNFTYTKPVLPQTPAGPGLISGADNLTGIPPGVTGNVNPGALIAGQNDQLFARPTGVQLPAGVANPFRA